MPDKYGVFDIHVKRCLEILGEDEGSCTEAIMQMRRIAQDQMRITTKYWTPRMVDKALWKLDQS